MTTRADILSNRLYAKYQESKHRVWYQHADRVYECECGNRFDIRIGICMFCKEPIKGGLWFWDDR